MVIIVPVCAVIGNDRLGEVTYSGINKGVVSVRSNIRYGITVMYEVYSDKSRGSFAGQNEGISNFESSE